MSVICARIPGVLRSSCILLGGEINHEEHEGHGEFRVVVSRGSARAFWGAQAASPQCSAACRAQNPVGKVPTVAGWQPALPGIRSERRMRSSVFFRSRCVLLLMMRFLLLAS